jgi:hypothetical protein
MVGRPAGKAARRTWVSPSAATRSRNADAHSELEETSIVVVSERSGEGVAGIAKQSRATASA